MPETGLWVIRRSAFSQRPPDGWLMKEGWNMRRIVHLSLGVLAGLLVTSTVAQAAADISIFAYPPAARFGHRRAPAGRADPARDRQL